MKFKKGDIISERGYYFYVVDYHVGIELPYSLLPWGEAYDQYGWPTEYSTSATENNTILVTDILREEE